MSNEALPGGVSSNPPAMVWTGRVLSLVPAAMLVMSGVMKVTKQPMVVEGFAKQGWPASVPVPLGIVELAATVLYLIPQTAVLGAVLITGYLGGAIATHVRLGESILIPAGLGVVVWLGLFLRDARLRQLLPLRQLE